MSEGSLKMDEGGLYVLTGDRATILVDNFSLRVAKEDGGAKVDVYYFGFEDGPPVESMHLRAVAKPREE
jgi:hypothetical protein